MAYTGLQPITQTLSTSQQFFSGDGSTQQFTLQQAVGKASDIVVVVGGSIKVPTSDYTALGGFLIFTSAPPIGTNNISVQFLAGALQTLYVTANTFVLGSNVNPSISGIGATTTGIYWPSTTSLGITVNGQNTVLFSSTPASTSTTSGALQVKGGVGITGATYIGGQLNLVGGQNSTGQSSGALVISGGIGMTGSMYMGGGLSVGGGLTVAGSFNTTSTNSLTVNTPFLFLANTNVSNAIDEGWVGQYENTDNIVRYTGMYRAASDGRFRVFSNLTVTPTTLIASSDPSFVLADMWMGNANVSAVTNSTSVYTGALTVPFGGVGIGQNLYVGGGIGAGGSLGTSGQVLSSTGSGISWITLTPNAIFSGASNVAVTANYVNVAVNGSNVFSYGAAAITSGSYLNLTANASIATLNAGTINVGTALVPFTSNAVNLGSSTNWWNTIFGVSINAHYADLAENYTADAAYPPGTVVSFGGTAEVTQSSIDMDTRVAGVISTDPAYLMNGRLGGNNVVAVALTGRVPCKVRGHIVKGDMMVSTLDGYARAEANPRVGSVIGKALENHDDLEGVIEIVVGKH